MQWIWGNHPVENILKWNSRIISQIVCSSKNISKIEEWIKTYKVNKNFKIFVEDSFNFLPKDAVHQNIAAYVSEKSKFALKEWINLNQKQQNLKILACDQIQDGQNLGAILRTCAAFEMSAVLITNFNCAALNGFVAKAAAGALEIVNIIEVSNLKNALEELKKNNFFVIGLDEHGKNSNFPKFEKSVLVVGQEGSGLRQLTKQACDDMIAINTSAKFRTLNVSVATAVAINKMYQSGLNS